MTEDSGKPSRAGAVARLIAMTVDLLIVNLFVVSVGLAATAATEGRVRIANSLVQKVECSATVGAADEAVRCERSLFGFVYDRTLESSSGGAQIRVPLDAGGAPVEAVYLDGLLPFALALYCCWCEVRFGATPGKRLLKLGVRSRHGGRPSWLQASRRLLRLVAMGSFWSLDFPQTAEASLRYGFSLTTWLGVGDFEVASAALNLAGTFYIIVFAYDARRNAPAPHDRWAGTDVFRLGG
jgi:uncharacterized RDD family membrane protein YckC